MDPVLLSAGVVLVASSFIIGMLSTWPVIMRRDMTIQQLETQLDCLANQSAAMPPRDKKGRFLKWKNRRVK